MACQPGRVDQAGLDILGLQPWMALKDGGGIVAGGKHVKDVLHRQTPSPDDRFSTIYFRIAGDSLEKLILLHGTSVEEDSSKGKKVDGDTSVILMAGTRD